MQAIVSALDDPLRERIEDVWGELKAVFGLKSVIGSTHPHFTYQVAQRYDSDAINEALSAIAKVEPPFAAETRGLGVFRGEETVLYLAVARDAGVEHMHARVWAAAAGAAKGLREYYVAATWVPHITLAIGDLEQRQLPEIMRFLGRREYRWPVPVTNLSLIPDTASTASPWRRYALEGRRLRSATS
ncbi:MAG: 2'-5' RNA ligase family protein [Chloroflexota bacterium]|nr:2'-5' RNA ligase family protein [Chloroflexota bacterium]